MAVLDAIRRPEYTGERRCWPCTVLNLAVVALAAVLVTARNRVAGLVVAVLGVGLVALRGYVVPYTPRFAPVIASRLPIGFEYESRVAERDPSGTGSFVDHTEAEEGAGSDPDPEAVLVDLAEAGVVTGETDLVLDRSFEADWEARMAEMRDLDQQPLAETAADAAPWPASGEPVENRIRLQGDDADVWLTRPAAIAETAAVETLVERGLDRDVAALAAHPLRMFLRECPDCGGPVVETTRADCCGATAGSLNPDDRVLACDDCGAELFTLEADHDAAGAHA